MAHKHGRGKGIVKRMRRIMRAGNILARQLPTEQARAQKEMNQELEVIEVNAEDNATAEKETI
jgi:hypothetical protein